MKNIFRFATMALAAVVLMGGVTSCDNKDEKESLTIDGKQWVTEMEGMGAGIDLGLKKDNTLCAFYFDLETLVAQQGMSIGEYSITTTDETSGTINTTGLDWMTGSTIEIKYEYRNLTKSSVEIDAMITTGQPPFENNPVNFLTFTTAPKHIEFEDMYDELPPAEEDEEM